MKFGHLEIFVTDPYRSKDFYCDVLGFELVAMQPGPCVWLKAGDAELLLRPGRNASPAANYRASAIAAVLYTENLPEVAAELAKRGLSFGEPDGRASCLTFADPDGNWFQLVDPADHSV